VPKDRQIKQLYRNGQKAVRTQSPTSKQVRECSKKRAFRDGAKLLISNPDRSVTTDRLHISGFGKKPFGPPFADANPAFM
jgi:hypothetical protein